MNRILIAGIGNIFLGDDAFGVEVAQALTTLHLPEGVVVRDFGIRSFDLAYTLLDDWNTVIIIDAVSQHAHPGTLFVIEPDLDELAGSTESASFDGHSMDPVTVLRLAQTLGPIQPRVLVVGCEPADLGGDEGRMGLSQEVAAAAEEAITMVDKLARELLTRAGAPAIA